MVAVQFDRVMFACRGCELAAERGGDQKEENSGTRGSCTGPKTWTWFRDHPSGGFSWQGCPRTSLDPLTAAWLDVYDRTDGKLSLSEYQRAPLRLLEALRAIDFVRGLQLWDAREHPPEPAPGGRR